MGWAKASAIPRDDGVARSVAAVGDDVDVQPAGCPSVARDDLVADTVAAIGHHVHVHAARKDTAAGIPAAKPDASAATGNDGVADADRTISM